MQNEEVLQTLKKKIGFSYNSVAKLEIYHDLLIKSNKKYNLISKNTEKNIWHRHILDSAQLLSFINLKSNTVIVDLGTGAGFPGLVLAIYGRSIPFHVKLYEKSPVKRAFLREVIKKLTLKNVEIRKNVYDEKFFADVVVCRAFRKLPEILRISRENVRNPHKLLILKGKNAFKEINNVYLNLKSSYKLEKSITDKHSKIINMDIKNND